MGQRGFIKTLWQYERHVPGKEADALKCVDSGKVTVYRVVIY
jgi:hypothetical protein